MHRFGALPFGVYRLDVEREGFSKQTVVIDVRSQVPIAQTATMTLMPVESAIVKTVNFERGRVRPSSSLDVSFGVSLFEEGKTVIRLQADVSI
jgi:hypothetical protein